MRRADLGPLRTDGEIGDVLRHVRILKLTSGRLRRSWAAQSRRRSRRSASRRSSSPSAYGSYVVTPGRVEHILAEVVTGLRRSHGAGDTFSATYLTRRAAGADPVAAARAATAKVAEFLA